MKKIDSALIAIGTFEFIVTDPPAARLNQMSPTVRQSIADDTQYLAEYYGGHQGLFEASDPIKSAALRRGLLLLRAKRV